MLSAILVQADINDSFLIYKNTKIEDDFMEIKGTNKQLINVFILFIISVFSLFIIKDNVRNSLTFKYKLNSPSGIFEGNSGKLYVIDGAKKKVLILDNNLKLINLIKGNKEKNGFYYASLICDDNNEDIYIADTVYSGQGTIISKERIIKYDAQGNFKENIYEIQYDGAEAPLQYGNILSLDFKDNKLIFILKSKNYIEVITLDPKTKVKTGKTYNLENIYPSSADLNMESLKPVIVSRKGDIYIAGENNELKILLKSESAGTAWKVDWAENHIYYTDLEAKEIKEISPEGTLKIIYQSEDILYTVFGKGENIYSTDYSGLITIKNGKSRYTTELQTSNKYIDIFLVIFILNTVFSFSYLVFNLLLKVKNILKFDAVQKSLIIIISSLLVSVLVGYLTFSTMLSYVHKNTIKDLNLFCDILVQSTDTETLKNIDKISDYRGNDYLKVKNELDSKIKKAYGNNIYYYYILYKASDNIIYGVMDYEDTMTSKHPFYQWEENAYTDVLRHGKSVEISNDESAYGTWSFVLKPIFDKDGKAIAIMEVGINTDEIKKNQKQIILNTVAIISCSVAVMIILMLEVIFIMKYKERKEKLNTKKNLNINFRFPLRSLIFISFFSDSMQDSFMPILSAKRYEAFFNIPQSIGIALPITLQLMNSALFSFLGGSIIRKAGVKKTMIFGFFSQMAGYIICAYTDSFLGLLAGKSFSGMGMGLIIVVVNTVAAIAKNEADSGTSFGEINAGILAGVTAGVGIGSVVLSLWNYSGVYYVAAIFICSGLLLVLMGEEYFPSKNKKNTDNMKIHKFILDKKVITFLALVLMPFLVALSYREYFFPLYAQTKGISEANIGYLYLVSGLIVIYTGPVLTNYLIVKFGTKKTLISSSILMCFGTLLFAAMPSLLTAIIGILSLTIAISFGYAVQSTYYTSLPAVSDYGESRAMGVYAVFDSGGQTVGPVIYGAALMLGYQWGMALIGGLLTIFVLIFLLSNLNKR